ncbi:MAG TPA: acetolactate synthase large subunit, partial [Byssovorax sp.]
FDPPLSSDVAAMAGAVSGWVRSTASAVVAGRDMADAIAAARAGQVASLVVPADAQWSEGGDVAAPVDPVAATRVDAAAIARAVATLRAGRAALILGGRALSEAALRDAQRVSLATGARLFCESFPARLERGAGLPAAARVPYMSELARATFADVAAAVLVGASDPVSFFGYQDGVSRLLPDGTRVEPLAAPTDDAAHALAALADAVGAAPFVAPASTRPPRPTGPLNNRSLVAAIAHMIPEGAVVIDEGVSIAGSILPVSTGAPRHSYLMLTGGACGQGMPCAAGAAIGAKGRKVIALVGDGSALYTVQALWTQAREGLDVVNVVCANDAYRILHVELTKLLGALPGPRASKLTELAPPRIDWGSIAKGFGVPACRAETTDALLDALGRALATPGPALIEARV